MSWLWLTLWSCVYIQGIYESGTEQSCTSGSGSGAPLLAQRTVASNIHLYEIIGNCTTLLGYHLLMYHSDDTRGGSVG